MSFEKSKVAHRNKSTLSYLQCFQIVSNASLNFDDMKYEDLDCLYAAVNGNWAYHLTRQGYIDSLNIKRKELRTEIKF